MILNSTADEIIGFLYMTGWDGKLSLEQLSICDRSSPMDPFGY